MILYVRSERSARSDRASRKLRSILDTWRELGHDSLLVCGADVYGAAKAGGGGGAPAEKPTRASRFRSVPGVTGIQMPLVHSVSEYRDMQHDRLLAAHLMERLGGRRPELVWHRASRLHLAPLEVAQQLGVPYVLEWIDRLVDYPLSLFRRRAVAADHRRMREALRVVVVSERWKSDVVAEYGIPAEKVLVAYNAVDAAQFRRDEAAGAGVRERLGIPADALVVGFVGSYGWQHHAHLIPEAAALLRGRLEKPVYYLMVGDGPNRPQTDAVARERGVEHLVLRQGRVPQAEVPAWLSAMDAAVVPFSGGEIICPIKVPEYMASSLAPIVADSAANREVVDHGRTGLLFRSGDAASMAEAIATLAAQPGLAAELGRAARREVEERFNWRETWGRALLETLASA